MRRSRRCPGSGCFGCEGVRYKQQKGENDCGVAALAMLADVRYDDVLSYLSEIAGKSPPITSGYIVRGLDHFGRPPTQRACRSVERFRLKTLKTDALLSAWLHQGGKKFSHWAVWDYKYQKVRDPYPGIHRLTIRSVLPMDDCVLPRRSRRRADLSTNF